MDDTKLNQSEAIRRTARFEAEAAVESRAKIIDNHSAAFRWMIASLFTLNGGAILAIISSGDFTAPFVLSVFWVFFLGITSTFLSVWLVQLSDRAMIACIHSWGHYWASVSVTAERDEEQETELKARIAVADKKGMAGRGFAVFAMIFFVLGVLGTAIYKQKAELSQLESDVNALKVELGVD